VSSQRDAGALQRVIDEFKRLPGIGARSAERIAFYLLTASREDAAALAGAIIAVKDQLRPCERCFNISDQPLCNVCANSQRDAGVIFVVEQPKDLINLESTGLVHGVYHVLMGRLSPLDGIGPEQLTIDALMRRVESGGVQEVVLALNPTMEGDLTALHISELLQSTGVKVTRLARGLAPGSQIEYANKSMLEEAIRGRG
jgi:recombination protein RecR